MHTKRFALGILLVTAFMFSAAPEAAAQEVGIKGGWVLSDSQDPVRSSSPLPVFLSDGRSGFSFGGFAVVPLGSGFALQPEVLFTRREVALAVDPRPPLVEANEIALVASDFRMQADYLEVPVLVRLRLNGDEGVRAHGLFGPSFAAKLGARLDRRFLPEDNLPDFSEAVRDLDVGLVFGGGVAFGSRWLVEGRYNLGLVDIRGDSDLLDLVVPSSSKWRSFGVTLGILF